MICFRLGRKHETQNRPLKIVLTNKSHRKYLLDNAKTLPEKAPTYIKDVITRISRDLTPEQRKERKSRRRQRASQQQQRAGTEQQDHDVETSNRPRIQFSAPQPKNIDQRYPSPIYWNMSHGNMYNDESAQMNPLETMMDNPGSAYEQSTMIGDTTVIGGVSQVNPDLENNS